MVTQRQKLPLECLDRIFDAIVIIDNRIHYYNADELLESNARPTASQCLCAVLVIITVYTSFVASFASSKKNVLGYRPNLRVGEKKVKVCI